MSLAFFIRRPRANKFGLKFMSRIAFSTSAVVSSDTGMLLFITRETVEVDTPARRATSFSEATLTLLIGLA